MSDNLLHVYGQLLEHDDVWIVGNKEALLKLRDIIQRSLCQGIIKEEFMTTDGEGYDVHIICNDTFWQGEFWKRLGLPYTGASSQDRRDNAIWPWDYLEEDKA